MKYEPGDVITRVKNYRAGKYDKYKIISTHHGTYYILKNLRDGYEFYISEKTCIEGFTQSFQDLVRAATEQENEV